MPGSATSGAVKIELTPAKTLGVPPPTTTRPSSPTGRWNTSAAHDLVLDVNVRDDAALAPEFVARVKEHGVLIPIAAVRGQDGVVRVRARQRRTPESDGVVSAFVGRRICRREL